MDNKIIFCFGGFILGGYLKSLITGCPVAAFLFIDLNLKHIVKGDGPSLRIPLPFVPELIGVLVVSGFTRNLQISEKL